MRLELQLESIPVQLVIISMIDNATPIDAHQILEDSFVASPALVALALGKAKASLLPL